MHLNVQTLVGLSGTLTLAVPYVSALLTQSRYARWVNELIAVGISVLAGVVSYAVSGGTFTTHDIGALLTTVSVIIAGAKLYYAKLSAQSPTLFALQWLTGDKQAGLPPPDALSPSGTEPTDPLPITATDTVSTITDAVKEAVS